MKAKRIEHTGRAVAILALSCLICMVLSTGAARSETNLLRVVKGKSIVLQYHEKVKTVSLANDDIADVVSVTPTELVVIGNEVGITSLMVWGESGKYTEYDVEVDRNTSDRQVVLEVQVAEVNRTAISEYGIDFLILDHGDGVALGEQVVGSYVGGVTTPDPLSESILAQEGITGVLKWLGNKQDVSAAIKALQKKGDLKLLANPHLISFSGEQANFLVGGEFPVPVAQTVSATGVNSVTIEWKEYGVRLSFVPTIVDTNLINLRIAPEVSSLDWANAVTFAGFDIPSLRTRKADATVEMNSQQSLVLGGLLSTETFKTVSRLPILGHIPILNFVFSRRETNTMETELLIVVSPRIIESIADETIPPLPGEEIGVGTQGALPTPSLETAARSSLPAEDTTAVEQIGTGGD